MVDFKGVRLTVLVLGIGNLIMSDDGIGVRVVQRLSGRYRFPAGVSVVDGGTLGLDLLPMLEGVDRLLVVDAVEMGRVPGSIIRLYGDDVPVILETRLSPHQVGLKDLLAVAMLQGYMPREMVLWGIQPERCELGMELSETVAFQLVFLVDRVLADLAGWGIKLQRISKCGATAPPPASPPCACHPLSLPFLPDLTYGRSPRR